MSEISLDCQGLPCPQPVLKTKEVLENQAPELLTVCVDNEAAKENVSRFLTMQGYDVTSSHEGTEFTVTAHRSKTAECEVCTIMSHQDIENLDAQKILVFISAETMGTGDDTLGSSLMFNFVSTLKELGTDLWRIVMVNGGVKLAVEGSKSLAALQELEKEGVSILVCGTCLEFFGLTANKQVGDVTNMLDIVTSFQLATKTIHV
ncbi:sulfurtransferase-like selenium metabolism protein YedF [Pseudodesulfovibrio sp. JC047]|uniref:sulfurtransferase-like selenium metabolism protein YedF n=1 Tax=Pseudodesulfovibrio sp. JC047 TaxID=2683199 RepID=UPI0013D58BB9|nr:sulfurtransferase-like selenium metabolism protein YedF [Pseudodesulfovibrio sp. JC047]NDV19115.1 sulfurtransferase-like selenium metabolism protein YedF [Pseudodesulfovibrio sp. JC047]